MWLGTARTITLWILLLRALLPMGSVEAAAQEQIRHCKVGMHWLDGWWRIVIVAVYFSGTLEGGWIGDCLEFAGEVLSLFWVFCVHYDYISHIHAWRAVFRVHHVGIYRLDADFWEMHSGSDRTPCKAIMWLVVDYLHPAEVSPNDSWNTNAVLPVVIMIFVKGRQSTTLWHACQLLFLVSSSCPSKELEGWVAWYAMIIHIVERLKWCITTIILIVSMLSFHYRMLYIFHYTFIQISFSCSFNCLVLLTCHRLKWWHRGAAFLLLCLPAPESADNLSTLTISIIISASFPIIPMIIKMTIQHPMMRLFSDHPRQQ